MKVFSINFSNQDFLLILLSILQNFIAEEISAMYEKISSEIEAQVQMLSGSAAAASYPQQMAALQNLVEMLKSSAQSRDVAMTAVNLMQKVGGSHVSGGLSQCHCCDTVVMTHDIVTLVC